MPAKKLVTMCKGFEEDLVLYYYGETSEEARRRVHELGGTLEVESTPGTGTPMLPATTVASPAARPISPASAVTVRSLPSAWSMASRLLSLTASDNAAVRGELKFGSSIETSTVPSSNALP